MLSTSAQATLSPDKRARLPALAHYYEEFGRYASGADQRACPRTPALRFGLVAEYGWLVVAFLVIALYASAVNACNRH